MPTLIINGQQVNDITLNGTDVKQISGGSNVLWQNENYRVATPVVSCTANVVTMTCSTSGATIKYSTNGGSSWSTYSSAITITATKTYVAYATKSGMLDSEQVSYTATYVQLTLPEPSITVRSTVDSTTWTIKTTGVSGVTYRYYQKTGGISITCSDITEPTSSTGNTKAGTGSDSTATITISSSHCKHGIKIIGTKSGYTPSPVKCKTYVIC